MKPRALHGWQWTERFFFVFLLTMHNILTEVVQTIREEKPFFYTQVYGRYQKARKETWSSKHGSKTCALDLKELAWHCGNGDECRYHWVSTYGCPLGCSKSTSFLYENWMSEEYKMIHIFKQKKCKPSNGCFKFGFHHNNEAFVLPQAAYLRYVHSQAQVCLSQCLQKKRFNSLRRKYHIDHAYETNGRLT